MKSTRFLLAVIMFFATSLSYAQVSNTVSSDEIIGWKGFRVGYSSYIMDKDNSDLEAASSLTLVYLQSFALSKDIPLYIETGSGIYWAFGEVFDENDYTENLSLLTIGIPVNIGYKYNFNDKVSIFPYIGARFKYHLKGEIEVEYGNLSGTVDLFDEDEFDGNRFQYGLQIGTTLNYKNINIGLSYGFELNEIVEDTKTSDISLTIGFNF